MNLIGDIHGNYRTLLALLRQMPDDVPVSLGDMIDRGPRSLEVLKFFRQHGIALLGNHEHMMLDYFQGSENYMPGHWLMNSGDTTLRSLGLESSGSMPVTLQNYLESLPLLLLRKGLLATHAPIHKRWSLEDISSRDHLEQSPREQSLIWNRQDPVQREGYFQVFGHNGYRYIRPRFFGRVFENQPKLAYAVCIDTIRGRVLSGLHWPSLKVFEQEYID